MPFLLESIINPNVRRGQNPQIRLDAILAAQPAELSILEHMQQLGLDPACRGPLRERSWSAGRGLMLSAQFHVLLEMKSASANGLKGRMGHSGDSATFHWE
jgi:hypothetical protein